MPEMFTADTTGKPVVVKSLYVADVSGMPKTVTEGWTSDTTGKPVRFWPPAPAKSTLSMAAGSPAWLQAVATWTAAEGATSYKLYANGTAVYTGTDLTYAHAVEPLSATNYYVEALNDYGYSTLSDTVAFTAQGMPAPTGFYVSHIDHDDVTLAWNGVTGAHQYELVHDANGSFVYTGAATSHNFAVAASSYYAMRVRATRNAVGGGWTAGLGFTTSAMPGPGHGDYEYAPNAYSTWQNGTPGGSTYDDPKWRPQSDGMWVNNGSRYGSTRGIQTVFWFYNSGDIQNQLRNGRVTRFRALIYRVTGTGVNAGQACRWWMHRYGGAPGGTPGWDTDVQGGEWHDTLATGEYKWIDLPAGWGQQFVDGSWKGIALGNDGNLDRHMNLVRDGSHATGNILITIG